MFSYDDGHPPLRNIILNILLRFTKDLNSVRLISLVPGLILIPLSFFLGLTVDHKGSKKDGILVGLLFAFLITFLQIFIQLSFETRPYMMCSMFTFIATFSTIKFSRTQSKSSLIIFCLSACLALLSNYPSMSIISICCLSIIILTIQNFKSLSQVTKILIFVTLSTITLLTTFQAHYLQKQGSLHKYAGLAINKEATDYISSYYIKDLKEIPGKLVGYFHFFCSSENDKVNNIASIIFFLAYILGLIVLIKRRSYLLLSISTIPFIFAIIAALAYLYPLGPSRHCTYLVLSVLISWAALLKFIFKRSSSIFKYITSLIICIMLILVTNINIGKDYVWRIGGVYGFHQIPENSSIDLFYKLDEFKKSNKLIVFDETSHDIVKQKMHIIRLKLRLKGESLNFPKSILTSKEHPQFSYCSDANILVEKQSCPELDDELNSNYKSIVVVSWNEESLAYAHKKIINAIKNDTKYKKEISHSDQFKKDWLITELAL